MTVRDMLAASLISEARRKAGYTEAELARLLKVSAATVIDWENGRREPRLSTMRKVVRACGLRMSIDITEPQNDPQGTKERSNRRWARAMGAVGIARSGLTDISENHDEYFVQAIEEDLRRGDPDQ